MKKTKPLIIITGSSGNIGSELSKVLQKKYKVVGLDRNKDNCDIEIDLTSDASVKMAFKKFQTEYGKQIAAVIHLAAYFDFTGESSPLYKKINVDGTKRLLHALQDFDVERFIFSSTMLVHEACQPGEVINENTPIKPAWAYPKSKAETEEVIKKHHGKIPYLLLRLAGLYDNHTCVPTLSHQIARIYERTFKSHLYSGDLEVGQTFIHIDDLTQLFFQAVLFENQVTPPSAT